MSIEVKNLELLDKSFTELEKLRKEVTKLVEIRQSIEDLKTGNENLPVTFGEAFEKVVRQANDYTKTLGVASKTYLDGSNSLFFSKLKELSNITQGLQKEISRLVDTDLTILFKDLQKVFIEQTKKDVDIELKKIGEKTTEFQTKITSFGGEIDRLEKVDLEKGFDKLQKTLSDIFGSINSINQTLTVVTQTLNDIVQSLGVIQTSSETNHKEIKQNIDILSESTAKHLAKQDHEAKSNYRCLGDRARRSQADRRG